MKIVAVAGLEPATCFRFTRNPLLPTELHGTIYIFLDQGSCRCQTLPKILGYSLMTYSEPRSICTFFLNSAFLRLIRLSFSPTLPSALHYYLSSMSCDLSRRSFRIRKLPCRFRLYLRVEYRLFHSFGLSVSFAAVSIRYTYRLAPWLLYLLSDLNKCFCLLTGIISIRPSAFVEGAGFEPTVFKGTLAITIHIIKHRACLRPLGQPSKYIVFYVSSFRKPANLAAGWVD